MSGADAALWVEETAAERATRLRAVAADAAARYARLEAELTPKELTHAMLAWAAVQFGGALAVTTSLVNATLPHLVSRHRPGVDVLFGDTGYHFAETLRTRDEFAARLDITIVDVRPAATVAEQDAELGANLFERDPGTCCALRKVAPMREALSQYDAWVTGVRRSDGPTRSKTPLVTYDEQFGLVKINPIANWTADDLAAYAERHDLPVNPLVAQGFPSIGCSPCTRAVAPGEDPRAGRWAGTDKTECGLHGGETVPTASAERTPAPVPLQLVFPRMKGVPA